MSNLEELDDHAAKLLLDVATKISAQFTMVFRFLVFCAFGAGVFFSMVHYRLDAIEQKMENLPPGWLLQQLQEVKETDQRLAEEIRLLREGR